MDGKQVECLSSIIAVLILGIVIIVHEFGHFLLAKTNGIVVEEFSVEWDQGYCQRSGERRGIH